MPDHAASLTLAGHIAIVCMQLAALGYKWISEGHRHRWEVEQRQTMAAIRTDIKNGHG